MTLAEELDGLSQLRQRGVLTDEEFARAKARLLNAEPGDAASTSAASAQSSGPVHYSINSFRRSRSDRVFGGVCGGIGRATGVESWVWRLIFVALFLFAGAGLLAYVLLWIFVPGE